ncbi:MAG TPA: MFS transporter [Marmoricola sp.]|nr:MFS transporter [Marmoricola sp.]
MTRTLVIDVRRSVVAVAALFTCNGLLVGAWGGSLPGLRNMLDLRDVHIVGALVTAGVFAVVAMQFSGRLADRHGARVPSFTGAAIIVASCPVIASARSYPHLLAGAALFGLGNGVMDVAMNALGVRVEQARGKPVMSRFHAMFSIGNFLGAGLVVGIGALVGADLAARLPLLAAAAVAVAALAAVWTRAPQTGPTPEEAGGGGRIPLVAWLLAAMALCFGLTEGTAVDWSSIHVTDVAHVAASTGAWGLACVSAFMVLIRLAGDHAVVRFGRRTVVGGGAACAMAGYLITAFASALPLILVGWCLVGFGVGLLAPQIYALSGHIGGGRTMALVVGFGYAAFLTGPAIIGTVTVHAGIQRAMLVPLATAVGLVLMARRMPPDPERG